MVGRSLQYSTTEGDPALRAAVADRLTVRGLPTHADELLITSGSQQALTLIATVLLEPGDTVLVEEPSYLAALQAFQLAGAAIVPVPCDEDGLDPEAAAALAERHGARLLYTIPTFQNPTGRTLPQERRDALVALARRGGFWLLEDDPYGELRYRGAPLPPLAALDDRVLSLSTLSKIAAPGLRIGWVRAPEPLRRPLTIAKQAADLHSSTVDQAAAAHWLRNVDLDERVGELRRAYGPRRDALIAGLAHALPPGLDAQPPRRGDVRVGAAARRLGRRGAARPRARARRRVRPRLPVLRRPSRTPPRSGSRSRRTPRRRSPRASAASARPGPRRGRTRRGRAAARAGPRRRPGAPGAARARGAPGRGGRAGRSAPPAR